MPLNSNTSLSQRRIDPVPGHLLYLRIRVTFNVLMEDLFYSGLLGLRRVNDEVQSLTGSCTQCREWTAGRLAEHVLKRAELTDSERSASVRAILRLG